MKSDAVSGSTDSRRHFKGAGRFEKIKNDLFSNPVFLCTERARLITRYFRKFDDPKEPVNIRKAKAFRYLLKNKSVKIYPNELIVGNVGSKRKSAIIHPELAGVFMCQELLWIDRRKTTPFQISWPERFFLMFRVIPYWFFRAMVIRAFYPKIFKLVRYILEQLEPRYYLINEVAGIGHFLPNYEEIIRKGVKGYLESLEGKEGDLYSAAEIACEGIVDYARRVSIEAGRLSEKSEQHEEKEELNQIARICAKVPEYPAETFHEALQSLWFSHLGVCLESINSAVSFGRMDQYLYPYYKNDIENGRITPERAKELILCFSAKSAEHVFIISEKSSKYHGGYLVVQAGIVGGMDVDGNDTVNDLSYLFLDVMETSGLREPNYQVRLHEKSPDSFIKRAAEVAAQGKGVPAFFSDEAVISSLVANGYPVDESRNYGIVGCVEPAIPGKSFFSTDAALFNLPICLEMALKKESNFSDIDGVIGAFKIQVGTMVSRLVDDLHIIEKGNRDFHPTPFSSMLVQGCLESGEDLTRGGALYNSSGIQGVGVADTADSLSAIDHVIFKKKKYSMAQLLKAMRDDFNNHDKMRAELIKAPKFGNDHHEADKYADLVAEIFYSALNKHTNARGGHYVPGFYSSTCHVAFGEKVGALPCGRKAGEPFAASLGAANGMDRNGPTALLNSVASINANLAPNGYALNLRFDPNAIAGDKGKNIISGLVGGFFEKGGMEMQLNVVDHKTLEEARAYPGKHPDLVVRVAGYCAYFDDLPDSVKAEIITRTRLNA
ncbi:pyruvate formate lyase family protein [Thermodesulfobacteriota bacterium]